LRGTPAIEAGFERSAAVAAPQNHSHKEGNPALTGRKAGLFPVEQRTLAGYPPLEDFPA
jgi:hypothetical protein